MGKLLAFLFIGLCFGGGLGFFGAAATNASLDGHDHSQHGHADAVAESAGEASSAQGHNHSHKIIVLPAGPEAPKLDLALERDRASGWNLHIKVSRFRFAPENVNKAHHAGEGHAHLYVNGKKMARVYGPWLHLPSLPKGRATVSVTLNSNDHRDLMIGGKPLMVSKRVVVD